MVRWAIAGSAEKFGTFCAFKYALPMAQFLLGHYESAKHTYVSREVFRVILAELDRPLHLPCSFS
jgi:hypothetical protein